jgi:hypothetical protein
MSIIFSIIRIVNFSVYKYEKWITYFITASFGCMWVAVLIQKIETCIFACQVTKSVAILQMTSQYLFLLSTPVMVLKFSGSCSGRRRGSFPHRCAAAVLEKIEPLTQQQDNDNFCVRLIAFYHCHYNPPLHNALPIRFRIDAHHRAP